MDLGLAAALLVAAAGLAAAAPDAGHVAAVPGTVPLAAAMLTVLALVARRR